MLFRNLVEQNQVIKDETDKKNEEIAGKVMEEYLCSKRDEGVSYIKSDDAISELLLNYFKDKGTDDGILLENIMQKYHFNYSTIIRNAIIHLFARDYEIDKKIEPTKFPGVLNADKKDDIYHLQTVVGDISVCKASPLFRNTSSNYIFYNHLVGECFNRSYDFIKENNDSKVVLSYMPNLFYGGHYHAYLELDNGILDIASNSFYLSKEDSIKVLDGRTIKKFNYEEVENSYQEILEEFPEVKYSKYNKLLILSLYHDLKDKNRH
jgi:hypothetical protein